jgi:hypothetical protein
MVKKAMRSTLRTDLLLLTSVPVVKNDNAEGWIQVLEGWMHVLALHQVASERNIGSRPRRS